MFIYDILFSKLDHTVLPQQKITPEFFGKWTLSLRIDESHDSSLNIQGSFTLWEDDTCFLSVPQYKIQSVNAILNFDRIQISAIFQVQYGTIKFTLFGRLSTSKSDQKIQWNKCVFDGNFFNGLQPSTKKVQLLYFSTNIQNC